MRECLSPFAGSLWEDPASAAGGTPEIPPLIGQAKGVLW
jgi:hypothetical protein